MCDLHPSGPNPSSLEEVQPVIQQPNPTRPATMSPTCPRLVGKLNNLPFPHRDYHRHHPNSMSKEKEKGKKKEKHFHFSLGRSQSRAQRSFGYSQSQPMAVHPGRRENHVAVLIEPKSSCSALQWWHICAQVEVGVGGCRVG